MPKKTNPHPLVTRERIEQLYKDMADSTVSLGPLDIDDIRLALKDWLKDREA
jgi:hypothetical protein